MFRRGFGRGYGPGMGGGRRGRGTNPFVVIMAMRLVQQIMALPHKPPATLGLMAVNTAAYFGLVQLPAVNGPSQAVCLQPASILYGGEWTRLVGSAFVHGDDMHLYFNMASLLWKGVQLEAAFGVSGFLLLTSLMLVGSSGLYVLAAWLGIGGLMGSCAIGFSGVLFALKTVLNAMAPRDSYIMGFRVPSRWAAWAELLLIQLMVPHASFAGHLCGILAGLAFVAVHQRANHLLPEQLRTRFIPPMFAAVYGPAFAAHGREPSAAAGAGVPGAAAYRAGGSGEWASAARERGRGGSRGTYGSGTTGGGSSSAGASQPRAGESDEDFARRLQREEEAAAAWAASHQSAGAGAPAPSAPPESPAGGALEAARQARLRRFGGAS